MITLKQQNNAQPKNKKKSFSGKNVLNRILEGFACIRTNSGSDKLSYKQKQIRHVLIHNRYVMKPRSIRNYFCKIYSSPMTFVPIFFPFQEKQLLPEKYSRNPLLPRSPFSMLNTNI